MNCEVLNKKGLICSELLSAMEGNKKAPWLAGLFCADGLL